MSAFFVSKFRKETMQTFLPYSSFIHSVMTLDNIRLNKQITEAMQIHTTILGIKQGWKNHPAVRMWQGYENALVLYGLFCYEEWQKRLRLNKRGGKLQHISGQYFVSIDLPEEIEFPYWLGNKDFHRSHRSNLIRKKREWYIQFFNEPNDLPYVWPI